jgi:AcrR family transcriptional regulator
MKDQKQDRRSQRTRRLLADALIALMLDKGYDKITVQDILDRADVGRSTFYAHFHDKEDLLISGLAQLIERISEESDFNHLPHTKGSPVLQLFQHVQKNHQLYQALTWTSGQEIMFKKGQSLLGEKFEQALIASAKYNPDSKIPLPILANHLAGSLITLLRWWLDNNQPYSPERMDEIFHQLVLPDVWATLDKNV